MQEMVASCVSLHAAIPYSDVDPSDTQHYSLLVPVVGREGGRQYYTCSYYTADLLSVTQCMVAYCSVEQYGTTVVQL